MKKTIFALCFIVTIHVCKAQVLYCNAQADGYYGHGTICKLDLATNSLTEVYNFNHSDGDQPKGALVRSFNGNLYGTTSFGGSNNYGVVFSYNPALSIYTKLRDFSLSDGINPSGNLVQASNYVLYGMTPAGGSNGYGTIFSFYPSSSSLKKIKDFKGQDGAQPYGGIIQHSGGDLYGMTTNGGANSSGVLFSYNFYTSTYTILVNFNNTSGSHPYGGLTEASDKKLYGMTFTGGHNDHGVIFSFDPVTLTYKKVWEFFDEDGAYPDGNLVQASDGKLYGMTTAGGNYGSGNLFSFDPLSNVVTTLFHFESIYGYHPSGSLTQASDGKLYDNYQRRCQ
jgi:uncharacterized repeat protein (TIGR03803 family)